MPGKYGGQWNGVDDDKKIAPWIHAFVKICNASAKGLKAGNPDCTVIAGAGFTSTAHLAIKAGLSKDVDGVSEHPYLWARNSRIF